MDRRAMVFVGGVFIGTGVCFAQPYLVPVGIVMVLLALLAP